MGEISLICAISNERNTGRGNTEKIPCCICDPFLFFVKRYAAFYILIVNFYSEIAVRKPIWRISDELADFQVRSCLVPNFPLGFDCFSRKLHKAAKPWIQTPNPLAFQASHLYQQNTCINRTNKPLKLYCL